MQNTSISRRQYKSRGRVISGYGRKAKNSRLRSQMLVTDNDESTYPALNTQKKRTNRMVHDLSTAVAQNVNNSKKHYQNHGSIDSSVPQHRTQLQHSALT